MASLDRSLAVSIASVQHEFEGPDLQQILAVAPVVIYLRNVQDDRDVFCSRYAAGLLGYENDTHIVDEGLERWLHPDDAGLYAAHRARQKCHRRNETSTWEYRFRRADGGWSWFKGREIVATVDRKNRARLIVGCAVDITDQKVADERAKLVLGEMRHRSKNFAAVIEAIASQTKPRDARAAEMLDVFVGRLKALLAGGEIVLQSPECKADFGMIAEAALAPFQAESRRIFLEGERLKLSERAAGGMALALHELATNALKYGALSSSAGRISLRWRTAGKTVSIEWTESGGPPVVTPRSEGFGTRLVKFAVASEPNHKIDLDYHSAGLRCRFEFGIG